MILLWQRIGVLLFDWWRITRALRGRGNGWMTVCNRADSLRLAPDGAGVECLWRWTSELHAAKVMPSLGRRLLTRALQAAPIRFEDPPINAKTVEPEVSVILGHRGKDRLPLLCATLKTLVAQHDVAFECLVVEHSERQELKANLPGWVRYAHVLATPGEPYNRARAFNEGVRLARGECLVFHDSDLLVPQSYLAEMARRCREGFEMINLKRYLFYIGAADTIRILDQTAVDLAQLMPEIILQNATGGGSLGVSRSAFEAVGGWDEAFEGWGGEDVDFWDRLQTRKVYPFGCFPLIHLWHAPQPDKTPEKDSPAMRRLAEISGIPVEDRIRKLVTALRGKRL